MKTQIENSSNLMESNAIINAKVKTNIIEAKLLYIGLYALQVGDYEEIDGNLSVEFSPSEIKKIMNCANNNIYAHLADAAKNLMGTSFGYSDPETNSFEFINLISYARYVNNILTIQFNNQMRKYILNLVSSGKFTVLNKRIMMSFKNVFSFKLYEVLKQYCYYPKAYFGEQSNVFTIDMSISELKFSLGVIDPDQREVRKILSSSNNPDYSKAEEVAKNKTYSEWDNFKRKCLDKAVKEINDNDNDMTVSYKACRGTKGKNKEYITFTVTITNNDRAVINEDTIAVISELFGRYGLKEKDIKSIAKASGGDIAKCEKAKMVLDKVPGDIDNITAFIIKAIKSDWEPAVNKKGKEPDYKNFKQNDYDFDDLEKQIIAN